MLGAAFSRRKIPMLKVYGPARSRAGRVLWMLEECGVPYEHEDLTRYATMDEKSAAMRAVYPLGKIPVLDDGDLRLAESLAINLHLARTCGGALWPASVADQARALQWSFFAISELEPPIVQLMIERTFRKPEQRDEANEKKNAEALQRPLAYLEGYLAAHEWLVGTAFTVADLNAASVFTYAAPAKLDLAPWPRVKAWSERCLGRPAYRKVYAPKT
jgi:glutathione S-transferase